MPYDTQEVGDRARVSLSRVVVLTGFASVLLTCLAIVGCVLYLKLAGDEVDDALWQMAVGVVNFQLGTLAGALLAYVVPRTDT